MLFAGKIVYGQGFTADCSIRDISVMGGCVRLPPQGALPPEFHLIVVRDGTAHKARTTWARPPFVGVQFESSHDLQRERDPEAAGLRELWLALAPRAYS